MYESAGILRYSSLNDLSKLNAFVEVGRGLADYYRSLVPQYHYVQSQMYPPHITVVRTGLETPSNLEAWGKHAGEQVPFTYDPTIHHDGTYYWLSAFSERIAEIRQELGLPVQRDLFKGYHITLGNNKNAKN